MYDRIIFFRERKHAERIELVSQSLPVLQKLGELEKERAIEPEQAELIRRGLLEGVTKFMSSGATIPEIEMMPQFDSRQLMSVEPKLLSASISDSSPQEDADIVKEAEDRSESIEERTPEGLDLSNLSEKEQFDFLRLLRKTLNNAELESSDKYEDDAPRDAEPTIDASDASEGQE